MGIINKILPLILTAIMSMNMSGCGNSIGTDGSQPAETSLAQTNTSTEAHTKQTTLQYPEPQPIPEGGWTYETLSKLFWVNGNYITLPCKFSNLGEGFDISTDVYIRQFGDNLYTIALLYNGKQIGTIDINCSNKSNKEGTVEGISVYISEMTMMLSIL